MDRKAILVLVSSFALLLLVYQLANRIYPPKPLPPRSIAAITNQPGSLTNQPSLSAGTNLEAVVPSLPKPIAPDKPEDLLVFTNDLARYTFSSHGGGIKLVELLKYKQR